MIRAREAKVEPCRSGTATGRRSVEDGSSKGLTSYVYVRAFELRLRYSNTGRHRGVLHNVARGSAGTRRVWLGTWGGECDDESRRSVCGYAADSSWFLHGKQAPGISSDVRE